MLMFLFFLSMFRCDHRVALFLSLSITVTEWPCWMVLFYEVVYVQQENTRASLTSPPCSWLAAAVFLFFTDLFTFFNVTKSLESRNRENFRNQLVQSPHV